MFSDTQSFLVVMALVGAMLFVIFLAGTKARKRPASARQPPRVLPPPAATGLLPLPPQPRLSVVETQSAPTTAPTERRPRHLSLVEARNGIVLATILGQCRANRLEESW